MHADDVRWLFAYDRWATTRVLSALDGVDVDVWERPNAVGDRGLGGILVHHLGASQRWRIGLESRGADEGPSPETEPLPTIDELREQWKAEWNAVDTWLSKLSDEFVAFVFDGVPVWQVLVHVVNHGTQHRAEAGVILTAADHSPGELDMINYAEDLAGGPDAGS